MSNKFTVNFWFSLLLGTVGIFTDRLFDTDITFKITLSVYKTMHVAQIKKTIKKNPLKLPLLKNILLFNFKIKNDKNPI